MATKIALDDLKIEQPLKIKIVKINGKDVEIKQYLPVQSKLDLITNVLQQVAQNEYPFANPVQVDVYTALEIIYHYTNIEIAEEAQSNPAQLYDELENQDLINKVVSAIPQAEYEFLIEGIENTIEAYYAYRNSVKGIIEDVTTDYENLNLDASSIQEKLADPNNMSLLKDVLKKLG